MSCHKSYKVEFEKNCLYLQVQQTEPKSVPEVEEKKESHDDCPDDDCPDDCIAQ